MAVSLFRAAYFHGHTSWEEDLGQVHTTAVLGSCPPGVEFYVKLSSLKEQN